MMEEEFWRRSGGHHPKKKRANVFSLLTQEGELRCEAVIKVIRPLIGICVSLIREDQYKRQRLQVWLKKSDITISQAGGKEMTITGMVWLPISIGGTNVVHKLHVAPDLYREMI